jgi:hypothetical protein
MELAGWRGAAQRFYAWLRTDVGFRRSLGTLLALGIFLRLGEYAVVRAFRGDELSLILNLEARSWAGLIQPLDYDQGAPLLFLWVEKLVLTLLGKSELALRLWPLVAGLSALLLFARWASPRFDRLAVLSATGVLAIAHHPIFFSTDTKQYSTDMLVTVLLLLAMERARGLDPRRPAYWGLAAAGAVLVWASHPAVFVIAGAGTAWLWTAARRQDRAELRRIAPFCAITAASFVAEYALMLRLTAAMPGLQRVWTYAFMPFPPASWSDAYWLVDRFESLLRGYSRSAASAVAGLLLIAGAVRLYRFHREWFWAIVLPFAFVLAASAAHRYPISSRFLLFLAPLAALMIGLGLSAASEFAGRWGRSGLAAATLAILLFVPQLAQVGRALANPQRPGDIRPLLERLQGDLRPDDCLLVFTKSFTQFRHYAPRYGLDRPELCVVRFETWDRDGFPQLQARGLPARAWLLFSEVEPEEWTNLPVPPHLELERIRTKDTVLLLFELARS